MKDKYLYAVIAVLAVLMVASFVGWTLRPSQDEVQQTVDSALAKQEMAYQARETAFKTQIASQIAELAEAHKLVVAEKDAVIQRQSAEISAIKTELAKATGTLDDLKAEQEKQLAEAKARDQGYVLDEVTLGETVSFNLDQGKLPFLVDGTISFKDDNYDVQERFSVPNGTAFVAYSAIDDEDFADKPYLIVTQRPSFVYEYKFSDPVLMSEISDDDPLTIAFLGKTVDIVEASASEVTIRTGTKYYLMEGQTVTIDGKSVTLAFVGDNDRVGIVVDGESAVLTEFDHETVGGLDVRVEDILVNARAGSAALVVGQDVLVTQKDGDYYMDDEEFRFEIESTAGELTGLKVLYDERRDALDDDVKPLALGDEIAFPGGFVALKFDKVVNTDYVGYDIAFEQFDDRLKNDTDIIDKPCVVITSTSDKGLSVNDFDVREAYVCTDGKIYYQDRQADWLEDVVANLKLINDDFEMSVAVSGGDLVFTNTYGETITVDTDFANEKLGATEDEAEATDVIYNANNFGNREKDVLLMSGIVLQSPESNADRDRVLFKLPSDLVEVELFIHG